MGGCQEEVSSSSKAVGHFSDSRRNNIYTAAADRKQAAATPRLEVFVLLFCGEMFSPELFPKLLNRP